MGILEYLGLKNKKREQIYAHLEPSVSEQYKSIVQENATLKAQLAKESAIRKKLQQAPDSPDKKEEKVIHELNVQNKKIRQEQIGQTVSLSKFILKEAKLKNNKVVWKKPIELTDNIDSEVFGTLGDIMVSTKTGYLIITDQSGNIMAHHPSLRGIIYKPESFGNQLKRRRILLPKTKDFKPVIDLDEIEMNDLIYDAEEIQVGEDGKPLIDTQTNELKKGVYRETLNYRKKFKELLEEREEEIRNKDSYIERLELAQVSQRKELGDLKRAIASYKVIVDNNDSEVSKVLAHQMQTIATVGDHQRKIANLMELKSMYEQINGTYESMFKKLLDKIEELGGKTDREIIEEEWKAKMDWAKSVLPETVTIQAPPEVKDVQMPQPGQVVGQRRNV